MVLVAGIAASVLVQTANRLEIQAMVTGEETTAEVSTGLHVVDIEGHRNATAGDDIIYLVIIVQPWAGADEVDLSQTYIEISDSDRKNVLKYDNSEHHNKSDIDGDVFAAGFFDGLTAQEFGIIVFEDGDGSCTWSTPVINRGDKAALTIRCGASYTFDREIPERQDIWGMVQPEQGSAGVFAFRTPASYTDQVMDLW
jgi:flagellin FlaB